jgi:hypothetical protein
MAQVPWPLDRGKASGAVYVRADVAGPDGGLPASAGPLRLLRAPHKVSSITCNAYADLGTQRLSDLEGAQTFLRRRNAEKSRREGQYNARVGASLYSPIMSVFGSLAIPTVLLVFETDLESRGQTRNCSDD